MFFVGLGVVCFASLGVALSHAIPNFDAAPAYVNAAFLPMIFISGVFYDADDAPRVIQDIAQALPLKHLIDGLSGAMVHGEGVGHHLVAAARARRSGRPPASCSPCAASPGNRAAPSGACSRPRRTQKARPPLQPRRALTDPDGARRGRG